MNELPTEVPANVVIASLQSQIADQALRIALLEARLSGLQAAPVVASNGEASNYAHDS